MTPKHQQLLPVKDEKVSPASAFMQYAAIPVFALMVYTFSKNLAVALAIVIFFYGNVLTLWGAMKLLIPKQRFFAALMVMNLTFMLMGLIWVSLSIAFDLPAWINSNSWEQTVTMLGVVYFVVQGVFVRQVTQAQWIRVVIVVLLAFIANALISYMAFSVLLSIYAY